MRNHWWLFKSKERRLQMTSKKLKLILLISLTMMLFELTCKAQTVTSVQQLPDKSYIVVIDGIEHRAYGPAKMRELEVTKKEHDAFQQDNIKANEQIVVLTDKNKLLQTNFDLQSKLAGSYKEDFDRSQEDAKRNYGLFIGERTLRQEATQFIPHGNSTVLGVKILKLFDSPYGQVGMKLVNPLVQTFVMSTK